MKVTGIIIKRRTLGSRLAFADIKCKDDSVVSVVFRSTSFIVGDGDAFPTKKSSLPFGATVKMILQESTHESGPTWEVLEWFILDYPYEQAQEVARQEHGGISCSKYLQARGDVFLSLSDYSPKTLPVRKTCIHERSHDDNKRSKALRAKVFSTWLIENILTSEDRVIDVAGGKGQLSMELAAMARISCTVVDPLVRKTPKMKRLEKLNAPLPQFVPAHFGSDPASVEMIASSTCLLGLHPDECTEDILNLALEHKKSVAIVPCCVFPSLFPSRRLQDGRAVNSYQDFLQYLLEKDSRLRRTTLPINGKNQVIYLKF